MDTICQQITAAILLCSALFVTMPVPLEGANILFFTPMGSPSHNIAYTPLIDELSYRGHNVSYLTLFKYESLRPNLTNVNHFFMESLHDYLEEQLINLFHIKRFNLTHITSTLLQMNEGICQALLIDEIFLKVALDKSTKYDLVIIDNVMSDCGLSLITLLDNPPFIYYSTAPMYSWTAWALSIPDPFATVPFFLMYTDHRMTFVERIINAAAKLGYLALRNLHGIPVTDRVIAQHFVGIPRVTEIEQNVSLVLTNSNMAILNVVRPTAPFVIEVGATHCRPANPLSKDLQDFIRGAGEYGFVCFSMGSFLRSSDLPTEKIEAFVNAFKRLKQRVIWKFEAGNLPELPPNVRVEKWLPQQDLLGDSNVRVFITHAGQLSLQEAVYHGVPIIGIPIFAEQKSNTRVATNKGYGQYLDYDEISEDLVYSMITESINNSSFKENAKYYSGLMKDVPLTPLETAVFWTEYVIRHKGARHFRLMTDHLNIFQYFLLDIIASVALVLFVVFYIIKKVTIHTFKKFRSTCMSFKYLTLKTWKNKDE